MAQSSPSAPHSTQLPLFFYSSSLPPPSLLPLSSCPASLNSSPPSIAPTTPPSFPLLLSPSVTPLLCCNNKHPIQLGWYMAGVSFIACCRVKRGESVGRLKGSGSQVMCLRLDTGGLKCIGKFHLCQVFAFEIWWMHTEGFIVINKVKIHPHMPFLYYSFSRSCLIDVMFITKKDNSIQCKR